MKKTILMLLITTFFSNISSANPNVVISSGMHMDTDGKLIQPDRIFMSYAIKAYRDGYNQSAYTNFKKAAALGNALSQRYVGLMYVNGLGVEKDLVKGYAWLKLAAHDNTQRNKKLEQQVFKLLSKEQLKQAQIEYDLVNKEYGSIAALTRRDRWVHKQKMKMTGSRTGSLAFAPIYFDTPHGNGFYNQVQSYVDDYNYGYVSSGEIIPVEESSKQGDKK
jgi:hypothetical protein